MNIKTKLVVSFIITSLLFAVLFLLNNRPQSVQGSVVQGSEYQATSTKKITGLPGVQNLTVLPTSSCVLGSVVITGANTGTITFYDATSTKTNTEWATTQEEA